MNIAFCKYLLSEKMEFIQSRENDVPEIRDFLFLYSTNWVAWVGQSNFAG